MTEEPTDFDLVVAARSGDRVSFERLLKRHCPRLLALARHIVGPDGAEDVMQEAALDAYRALDGFAGKSAVGTWLYRHLEPLPRRAPPAATRARRGRAARPAAALGGPRLHRRSCRRGRSEGRRQRAPRRPRADATARALEGHLETCPNCPPLYASLIQTLADLKALGSAPMAEDFAERVAAALATADQPGDAPGPLTDTGDDHG